MTIEMKWKDYLFWMAGQRSCESNSFFLLQNNIKDEIVYVYQQQIINAAERIIYFNGNANWMKGQQCNELIQLFGEQTIWINKSN